MKLLVINSVGPMGSTVAGATAEKLGYTNIPVRKIGLHSYLLNQKFLDNPFMKNRMLEIIKSHSSEILLGGVSVHDRDSADPRRLVDINKIQFDLDCFMNKKYTSVQQMYIEARQLYLQSCIYKKINSNSLWHIEYTTDIHLHANHQLREAYAKNFDEVYFINMNRDFESWIDSLCSQHFNSDKVFNKYVFVLHSAVKIYKNYQKAVSMYPGLTVDFHSMFIPNEHKFIKGISSFLNVDANQLCWAEEEYDLYGKLSDYKSAFTKADTGYLYLSKWTIQFASYCCSKEKMNLIEDLIFEVMYLFDLLKYKLKMRFVSEKVNTKFS